MERLLAVAELNASERKAAARMIGRVRSQGFAFKRSNQFSGLEATSYPVLDLHGRAIAALTVPYVKRLDEPDRMSATETQAVLGETVAGLNTALGSAATVSPGGKAT